MALFTIPDSVIVEARAEIIWGKPRAMVLALLQSKGVRDNEAAKLLDQLIAERAAILRAEGRKKIGWGVVLALALVVYCLLIPFLERSERKALSFLVPIGLYGVYKIIKGVSMVLRPGGMQGDLANSD